MSNDRLQGSYAAVAKHVPCGDCRLQNTVDAKFCAGCGQTLYEPCVSCCKPVLLTQSFCDDCGANLGKSIESRHQRHQDWMVEAVQYAKEKEFDRAIDVLGRVAELTDYRFKEAASDAAKAIEKIRSIRERTMAAAEAATRKAMEANQRGDLRGVVVALQSVDAKFLSEDARQLLSHSQRCVSEWSALEKSLATAIAEKDWSVVGRLTQQLLELDPANSRYLKLAEQVASKLVVIAKRLLDDGQYDSAVARLDSIPEVAVSEEVRAFRAKADDIRWLSQQFDSEPYATPMLGRLAVRFAKETPSDPRTRELVQQLSKQLKQASRPPRMHLPVWKGSNSSWLGGEVGVLAFPKTIRFETASEFKAAAARLNVAIGLAIQGLGKGRISEDLLIKKKGLLSFGKRKVKNCWGLDVGTSAIKGVLIQETDAGLEIVDSFFCELEVPLKRRRTEQEERSALLPEINKFLEQKQPGETPVWVNLTASVTVNRFVRLPPVKDKEANGLLIQEIENSLPVPIDELVVAKWIHEAKRHPSLGRPAIACTARQSIVAKRVELFESCGLKVAGIQCDAVALVNYAAYEFADTWPAYDSEAEGDLDAYEAAIAKAITLIDCGASTTNVIIVSGEAQWCWTLEVGGDDLTFQIASATKVTRAEAEKLKRNPASLTSPATQYAQVETSLDHLRARLSTIFSDGLKQGYHLKPTECWCMGGAWQTHQWIRRVALAPKASQ